MGRLINTVEQILKRRQWPYIAVDEAKKALFNGQKLKCFHFVVYFSESKNWLVQCGNPQPADREDLRQWQDIFGDGFRVVLAQEHKAGIAFKDIESGEVLAREGATTKVSSPPITANTESKTQAKNNASAFSPPKTTSPTKPPSPPATTHLGQQQGLLGARYDGGIAGGKSGSLFGDIRAERIKAAAVDPTQFSLFA